VARWFLEYFGLAEDADERAIKRSYAARLKHIDRETDIDGFAQLHSAYQAALSWTKGERTGAIPAPSALSAVSEPPIKHPTHSDVVATTPASLATAAIATLRERIDAGDKPAAALLEQVRAIRDERLDTVSMFEALLIDGLAKAQFSQRLALFHAAIEHFPWADITHLTQLGRRGDWIRRVTTEEAWVKKAPNPQPQVPWLATMQSGLVLPDHYLWGWPALGAFIDMYRHYFSLCVDEAVLEQWEQAYAHLIETQEYPSHLTSSLGMPVPMPEGASSPEAYRWARGKSAGSAKPAFWAVGIFLAFMLVQLITFLTHSPKPPPSTKVEMRLSSHTTISSDSCAQVDRFVHSDQWAVPDDETQRDRFRTTIEACRNSHYWPTLLYDKPLTQLGIHTS
jgi:hypothetical protein